MKKHLSVLMLYIGASFHKMMGILTAMVAVELAGYHLLGYNHAVIFGHNSADFLFIVSFVAYLAMMLFLIVGPGRKDPYGYTLQRLQISERWVFIWNTVANMLYLTLLWMVQILVVAVLAKQCLANPDYPGGLQGVYMDLYRSRYLHGLLPMKDVFLWVRNILNLVGLATAFAYMSLSTRYGKTAIEGAILIGMTAALFTFDAHNGPESIGFYISVTLVIVIIMVSKAMAMCHKGVRREDSHV